jgi:hypothetical protein
MLSDAGVGQWLVQPCGSSQVRRMAVSRWAGKFGFALPLMPLVLGQGSLAQLSAGPAGGLTARPADNGE